MTYCCPAENEVQEKYEGDWAEGRMHGRGAYWYVLACDQYRVISFNNSTTEQHAVLIMSLQCN